MSSAAKKQQQPLIFKPTCDVYDDLGEKACRVPEVDWKSYGAVKQFCGVAVTVKCLDDNSSVRDQLLFEGLSIGGIGDGKVLVVDGGGSKRCALLGDRLAAAAEAQRWAGIVVYGCVRDVDALSALDVGILAIGSIPKKSTRPLNATGQVDVMVQIGSVWVNPGDLVYADNDGVVFVSPDDMIKAGVSS